MKSPKVADFLSVDHGDCILIDRLVFNAQR